MVWYSVHVDQWMCITSSTYTYVMLCVCCIHDHMAYIMYNVLYITILFAHLQLSVFCVSVSGAGEGGKR